MQKVKTVGFGVVGAGYMGKAHSVALSAVGAVFNTRIRPRLEMICTTTEEGARARAQEFGFARGTADWRKLVNDPKVEAIVIAGPQKVHLEIAQAALALGKPVFCEKPLGQNVAESRAMVAAAEKSGCVNMVGFNYIRTPASQLARQMIAAGEIGDINFFRGEHTEDFLGDPAAPNTWRTKGRANGNMGDLSPHIINAALALAGPLEKVMADIGTVYPTRPGAKGPEKVENDDQASISCRFESGAMGQLFVSRAATGRKMGYAYDVYGSKGAIRFDQEDQNALWFYDAKSPVGRRGFTKILTGPEHPDYVQFCQGPGHGTGYQDQIIIEQKDFLEAMAEGNSRWPTFRDGLRVNQIVEACWQSHDGQRWININEV